LARLTEKHGVDVKQLQDELDGVEKTLGAKTDELKKNRFCILSMIFGFRV